MPRDGTTFKRSPRVLAKDRGAGGGAATRAEAEGTARDEAEGTGRTCLSTAIERAGEVLVDETASCASAVEVVTAGARIHVAIHKAMLFSVVSNG